MQLRSNLSRRDWLKLAAASTIGGSQSGWLEALAADTANHPERKRACILLWMSGGPSQMDTFDLKPGQANGGPYQEIATNAPGVRISEHLPKLAKFGDRLALVRSLNSKEGDHGRASFFLRTGYLPSGPIRYPILGSLLSKELGDPRSPLPNFVSVSPTRLGSDPMSGGFLGPQHAPLILGMEAGEANASQALKVPDLKLPEEVTAAQTDARVELLKAMQQEFARDRNGTVAHSREIAYERALQLMRTSAAKAFDLEEEKATVRDAYGRGVFGQGCLLARRLVERGVPFVEVTLNGWDTHNSNFTAVQNLSNILDPAWAMLMQDLQERGLLDSTLIVWMGEFGRTPRINGNQGRDHWPKSFSAVLGGGGIKGGQVIGKTSADGVDVADRPVTAPEFLATVCQALGVDPMKQNLSNVGRPIRIVQPNTKPVEEALS